MIILERFDFDEWIDGYVFALMVSMERIESRVGCQKEDF